MGEILTFIFAILMIIIFGKLIIFAFKAAWGILRILFTLVFLPLVLIGLVLSGLLYAALIILLIVGIIVLITCH